MSRESLIVVVRLIGGLGNQLFQIQRALDFVQANGGQLAIEDSFIEASNKAHEAIALPELIAPYPRVELPWKDLKFRRSVERIFYKFGGEPPRIFKPIFLFETTKDRVRLTNRVIIDGFWQDKKYLNPAFVSHVRGLVMQHKSVIPAAAGGPDAVCMHVRRGDYLTNRHFFIRQQTVLGADYYRDAMASLLERNPSSEFHLYTDDEPWARAFYANARRVSIIGSAQLAPAELLAMMMSYRHFIIANSSLSWWAAVLSPHADKKVLLPKTWGKTLSSERYRLDSWAVV